MKKTCATTKSWNATKNMEWIYDVVGNTRSLWHIMIVFNYPVRSVWKLWENLSNCRCFSFSFIQMVILGYPKHFWASPSVPWFFPEIFHSWKPSLVPIDTVYKLRSFGLQHGGFHKWGYQIPQILVVSNRCWICAGSTHHLGSRDCFMTHFLGNSVDGVIIQHIPHPPKDRNRNHSRNGIYQFHANS